MFANNADEPPLEPRM